MHVYMEREKEIYRERETEREQVYDSMLQT